MKPLVTISCGLLALSCWPAAPAYAQAATQPVVGHVAGPDGEVLIGASVLQTGTSNSTVTNAAGDFSLRVPVGATLTVSALGYTPRTVPASGGSASLSVTLPLGHTALDEAVVIGYGIQPKTDLTGVVAQVPGRALENVPVVSFEQAMQGRTPGVEINQASGKLGALPQIRVRGSASITASAQPLYVLDGIIVTSTDQSLANYDGLNPLADLNPNDIETISILKDAVATAIYGARASNGVVVVTTKKGRAGASHLTLNYYTGVSRPTRISQFLNADQYRELYGEALVNSGYVDPSNPDAYATVADALAGEGGVDYNSPTDERWTQAAFRPHGRVSEYDLTVGGGDARTRFYFSGAYRDELGILAGNQLRRGSARLNLEHNVRERLRLGLNLALVRSLNDRVADDGLYSNPIQLNANPPLQPLRTASGQFNRNTLYYNSLLDLELGRNRASTYRAFGTAYLSWEPVQGLMLRSELGGDFLNLNEDLARGAGTDKGGLTGYAFSAQTQTLNYTTNQTATYRLPLPTAHRLEVLAGFSYQRSDAETTAAEGRGFPTSAFTRVASSAVKTGGTAAFGTSYAFVSAFGRLNYAWRDKWLLSGSVRRDGSSRFGVNNRYGTFGAAGVGYVLSEESFLKDSRAVSFLKIRASYGLTGNAEIANFAAPAQFYALPYGSQAGIAPGPRTGPYLLGNPNLTWENTRQLDLGVEFGLLGNRLTGEIDVYEKYTTGLLLNRPLPYTGGFDQILENNGELRNRGLEVALTGRVLTSGPLTWTVGGNISFNRNRLMRLSAPVIPGGNLLSQAREGEPLGVFWGKAYAGVDPATGDALYYSTDGGTTADYNAAPTRYVGNPNPQYTGGVHTTLGCKGLELSALGYFSVGNDIYSTAGVYQSNNASGYLDNQTVDQLRRWRQPGDVTDVPQARYNEFNGASPSSRWVQDGSFFRLKTLTLAYSLPATLTQWAHLQTVRFYLTAQNLLTLTHYTGYDPEVKTGGYPANIVLGHSEYTPPLARTFLAGVTLGL